jgi:hypothetical protein|tara:strand:- start:297 stop:443 length:147 start_codon:yes stop_codon:yes gene_type:complete
MLAESCPEYVFVAVSPNMVPEVKSQSKRALIDILGTFCCYFAKLKEKM